MATLFIDYENGNDNWGGTSFAPVASGVDGRITSNTFSSVSANFLDNGTYANKNLIAYSQSLNNAQYFAYARTTISSASITPPTGITGTLWNILETLETNTHDLRAASSSFVTVTSSTYTVSCYARANGRNQLVLRFGDTAAKGIRYNISTGTIAASGASATGTITDAGNGWYRLTLTATADNAAPLIYFMLAQDSYTGTTAESYTGDPTRGFYITSPQLELSGSATSYETPPSTPQYLSIFNGTSYVTYQILNRINSTSLNIMAIMGGTALANQAVDRQYFIGGRWQTITTGLTAARTNPGDIIRVMASPDPTLVGNATFTSSKAEATRNISSSTNASPIAVTMTAAHGYVTGDTIIITGHTTNTNANGTWEITVTSATAFTLNNSTGNGVGGTTGVARRITNGVVRLANSVTANIASFGNRGSGRTAWTAVAGGNVSTLLDTSDTKEGDVADYVGIAAAFTTGKAAYKTLSSTLNLSGYQQISFWIKITSGNLNTLATDVSLALCSDSIGDIAVNTFNIPVLAVLNRWVPVTINLGTNLGSSIQSIALYIDTDRGAQVYYISNIVACKARSSADSLNLQSIVGKNTASEKWWGGIQSINGTRVILDQDATFTPIAAATLAGGLSFSYRGYDGTSETTSLFKRETIKTPMMTTNTANVQQYSGDSGIDSNNLVYFEFGFDRTNMSTRTGETFFDGLNGFGAGLWFNARNFISVQNAGFVRYWHGIMFQSGSGYNINNIWTINSTNIAFYPYILHISNISNIYTAFNSSWGVFSNVACQRNTFNNIQSLSSGGGFYLSYCSNNIILNSTSTNNNSAQFALSHGVRNLFKNCSAVDGGSSGLSITDSADDNVFLSCTTTNNTAGSVAAGGHGANYIRNCTLNETTEVTSAMTYSDGRTIFINTDNSTNNFLHFTDGGTIYNTVAVRYSNSGFAWALAPTSSTIRMSSYPLALSIARVSVNANNLVVVRAWMRRNNISLTTGLRIKGDQIAGVPNDITSYMSAAADTWEQVTINFTPTEAGVVEILAECFGGTTFTGYVDDISVTQI
jgi:hypothetical protein